MSEPSANPAAASGGYSERVLAAFEQIDAANAADPNEDTLADGTRIARELIYGQRMSAAQAAFAPDAPESVQLAARAQHIRRWEIPRADFPMDRAGYHRWRTTLYKFHADRAGEILKQVGFAPETIERVNFLLQKKKLRSDVDTQQLEDIICLTFLEHYFLPFAVKHPEDKVVDIVRKTWGKMSSAGQAAALKLDLAAEALRLINRALEG